MTADDNMSRVKEFIAQNPETVSLEREAQVVHQEWTTARIKFLQVRALFQALKETQYEVETANNNVSRRLFTPDNTDDLQGLAQPPKLPILGPKSLTDLHSKLDSATDALLRFYPEASGAADLPEAVAADVADADSLRAVSAPDLDLAVSRKQTDDNQLRLLTDIVDNNYMKSASERIKATTELLVARQSALEKKLDLTKIEVKTATYNSTAVALLERLRHKLSKDTDQAKSEVDRIRKELAKYQTVSGTDFKAIVDTYATIMADIEGKEWALSRFKEESNN